jgi:hypothetical protein
MQGSDLAFLISGAKPLPKLSKLLATAGFSTASLADNPALLLVISKIAFLSIH